MKKILLGMALAAGFLSACNNGKTSAEAKTTDSAAFFIARNVKAALRHESIYTTMKADSAFLDLAPGYLEYFTGEDKPVTTLDSIKKGYQDYLTSFPDLKFENLRTVAQGDTVIITADWTATFTKEYLKIKPTGKSYKVFDVDIYAFNKAGKIISHRSVQSNNTYFHQLGATLLPHKQ